MDKRSVEGNRIVLWSVGDEKCGGNRVVWRKKEEGRQRR